METIEVITNRYSNLFQGTGLNSGRVYDEVVYNTVVNQVGDVQLAAAWLRAIERDALAFVECAWRFYMPLEPFDDLLQRVRDRDPGVFNDVKKRKEAFATKDSAFTMGQVTGVFNCCSVFFCALPGYYTINQLPFCRLHAGLAMINARRHECRSAFFLALKKNPAAGTAFCSTYS